MRHSRNLRLARCARALRVEDCARGWRRRSRLAENGVRLTFKSVEFIEGARETLARSPEAQRLYLGNGARARGE